MKHRRRMSRRRSKRVFRKGAMKVHKKNLPGFRRGGIAL